MTLSGFMGYIFLVTLQPPEQNSEALINLVLGYLGGLASAVISFYFGASQSKRRLMPKKRSYSLAKGMNPQQGLMARKHRKVVETLVAQL